MDALTRLGQVLDPLRPLGANEVDLYVDWMARVAPDEPDTKSRMVRAIVRQGSPDTPITRLLTGHRGVGKTSELNRVARRLESGEAGRTFFVSTLSAVPWVDVEDLRPEELVLQMARQLVADLTAAGFATGKLRFTEFFKGVWARFRGVSLDSVELDIPGDPLKFSFSLKDFPAERQKFRDVLRGQLPTLYSLLNQQLLPEARRWLMNEAVPRRDDIVLIVDDLDKIDRRSVGDERDGLTNHELLFVDQAAALRSLAVNTVLTLPIELAYSPLQNSLKDLYGAPSILTVPVIPLTCRPARAGMPGEPLPAGEEALREVLSRRARKASLELRELFGDELVLRKVLVASGGHVRGLLVLMSGLVDWFDAPPFTAAPVDRFLDKSGKDLMRGLSGRQREILREVGATNEAIDDPEFYRLLRTYYVYAYEEGDDEYWYGVNPLVAGRA